MSGYVVCLLKMFFKVKHFFNFPEIFYNSRQLCRGDYDLLISSFSLLPISCLAMDGLLRLDSFIVHS